MRAIILAGGKGTRLQPYTYSLPKPLMPIGGEMPILEIILKQLKKNNFERVTIAVNYMAKIIQAFFGNGEDWGLEINYSMERKPLGTVGPLTLINDLPENFLVMNGDLLTDFNFKKCYNSHIKNNNDITIGTFRRKSQNDSGVLIYDKNLNIYEFREKPIVYDDINMGIYVLNKSVIDSLPKNEKYGFDQLIIKAINQNLKLKAFPHNSCWLDIGSEKDYQKANEFFRNNKEKILDI